MGGFSFKYNYTSDIQIVPRYVQKNIASAAVIKANLGLNSDSFTYDEENKTWSVEFPYGVVSGIARCVNVWPFNLAFGYLSGYVPNDEVQEEISADLDGGRYCYCKLVSPLMDNAKWVLYHGHSEESICGALCARDCSEYAFARHGVFRSAMLVGAR